MTSEDLLDHFKLEAEVSPSHTLHFLYQRNRERGVREKIETKWKRVDRLGEGAFGEVWREVNRHMDGSRDDRAVKVIEKRRMARFKIDFKKELLALAKFSKEEYRQAEVLVSFLGWFETDSYVFLAMEYFKYGDLARHIPQISDEEEIRQIMTDLLDGLAIIHGEGFAHRDLKPENIFVVKKPPQSRRWWVKIGDFGISKRVRGEDTALRTQTGTPLFQAPEVWGFVYSNTEEFEYSSAVDLWSLGCVGFNISAQRVPFAKPSEINSFCHGHTQLPEMPLSARLGVAGRDFIKRLLVAHPAQRMTVEQALIDPWLIRSTQSDIFVPDLIASERRTSSEHFSEPKMATEVHERSYSFSQSIPEQSSTSLSLGVTWTSDMPNMETYHSCQSEMPTTTLSNQKSNSGDVMPEKKAWIVESESYKAATKTGNLRLDQRTTSSGHDKDTETNDNVTAIIGHQDEAKSSPSAAPYNATKGAQVIEPTIEAETLNQEDAQIRSPTWSETLPAYATQPRSETKASLTSEAGKAPMPREAFIKTGLNKSTFVSWKNLHRLETTSRDRLFMALAYSPDSAYIASTSMKCSIALWNALTGNFIRDLDAHAKPVRALAFSPDGTFLASGAEDKVVRLWNMESKAAVYKFTAHTGIVQAVTFSPDGKLLASSAQDKTIRVFNVATKALVYKLSGDFYTRYTLGVGNSVAIAFSPNSELLAAAVKDKIEVWKAADGAKVTTLGVHPRHMKGLAFSADSQRVAGVGTRGVWVWQVDNCEVVSRFDITDGSFCQKVTYSPNGEVIAFISTGKTVRLFDAASEESLQDLESRTSDVISIAFSPDGKTFAYGTEDGVIQIWNTNLRQPSQSL